MNNNLSNRLTNLNILKSIREKDLSNYYEDSSVFVRGLVEKKQLLGKNNFKDTYYSLNDFKEINSNDDYFTEYLNKFLDFEKKLNAIDAIMQIHLLKCTMKYSKKNMS
ncbi:hypothetical protein [Acinetobacter towneri]|uniref:hypothetical protein n=1 Tax=Acinetobacter towneri TaxID=202956 RepID=UPI001F411602|nr:hypothetical protein [Acinetobacter towneri]UIP26524.1 hypothetical protein LZG54_14105 [Acinetobacter towneri]